MKYPLIAYPFIGIYYMFYGIFWLIYNGLKGFIFGFLVSMAALFTALVMPITVLFTRSTTKMWAGYGQWVKRLAHSFWGSSIIEKIPVSDSNISINIPENAILPAAASPTLLLADSHKTFYCPGCGEPFTEKMTDLAQHQPSFYCEYCGQLIETPSIQV